MAEMSVLSIRWQVDSVSAPPPGRRSAAAASPDTHLARIVGDRFEVEREFRASSPQRRGAEPLPLLDVTIPAEPGAAYLLALRQEGSNALSFHAPVQGTPRRGVTASATVTFEVEFPEDVDESVRRSLLTKAVKAVVLKAAGKFADLVVPWVGSEVESFIWSKKNLKKGWLQVDRNSLVAGAFADADFSKIQCVTDRCLLLLHGTFSNTAGGFGSLAGTQGKSGADFFNALTPLYADRIYAFNHFTLSQTPEQNANDLIAGLPKAAKFDVITHSRGGLVLRNLVERQAALGGDAARFQVGQVVMVASPNIGTPLATADRFDQLISWWANVLELFPENPFSTTLEYVGEALTFIARHVVDALPGLESMDMSGSQIKTLNELPSAPATAYSALVSNHRPQGNLLARMLDLGIDGVFGMANDLVVPTAGAWQTDLRASWVSGARIGCFGLNLQSPADVIHTNYFAQPETVDFLIDTFTGVALNLPVVDPDVNLPFFLRRSIGTSLTEVARPEPVSPTASAATATRLTRDSQDFNAAKTDADDNVLQLFLISPDDHIPDDAAHLAKGRTALLLATYRNARVVETIYLRHKKRKGPTAAGDANEEEENAYHWNKIIGTNEAIKSYVDGKTDAKLPNQEQLLDLGVNLFNAMFPGAVRRLYDVARVDRARAVDKRRLNIILTSMINWVADKPWEFSYDPNRQSFLATEAVNFTRNVLTAVPADEFAPHPGNPIRILVVVAQPIGMGLLSAAEEEQVIRRGFQELEDLGLVTLEYMMNATIEQLHRRFTTPDIDILHFIGHGVYVAQDADAAGTANAKDSAKNRGEGFLVFRNADGAMQMVSADSLRQVLCNRGIRLVFLNACETGMVGRSDLKFDFNRGVAPKLVAGGIPVLVANQYKVLDVSATEFAKQFYRWLALGATVGDAAREARVAVNYSIAGETIDWAVPVVYARNPGRTIYTGDELSRIRGLSKAAPRVSRTGPCRGFRGVKIGLWDVNHVLPQLEDFAARLRSVQGDLCFQSVDMSAPLGTWRQQVPQGGGEARSYIVGDEVANKLKDHVTNLGIDRLICITTFPLADIADRGLALWNLDESHRISIVSCDLIFREAPDPKAVLNQFLVNMIVAVLCDGKDHPTPPGDCPNHSPVQVEQVDDKERLAQLTGKNKFCCDCLAKQKRPDALNHLLTAW